MRKTKMLRKLFKIEEKWVVFYDLFSKKRNGDSILPIAEKLRKERPDFKFFFCKKRGDNIEKIYLADEVITEKSLYFKYVLAKAKYVVSPMNFPKTKKRDGQKFIQTWHGTPLKKLYLSRDGKSKHNKRYAARISQNTDIFCVSCDFAKDAFKDAFGLEDSQFICSGLPRNDILSPKFDSRAISERIKTELGLPKGKKIILYCPTWRRFDKKAVLPFDLQELKKAFSKEYSILIRSHVGKHSWVDANGNNANIFDGEFSFDGGQWDEICGLYLVADLLITDYSSAAFDFAITQKPQIMYAYDLEEYQREFGLYLDYENEFAAFPVAKNTQELIDFISGIGNFEKQYGEKYRAFLEKFCAYEKGDATDKIVNYILSE